MSSPLILRGGNATDADRRTRESKCSFRLLSKVNRFLCLGSIHYTLCTWPESTIPHRNGSPADGHSLPWSRGEEGVPTKIDSGFGGRSERQHSVDVRSFGRPGELMMFLEMGSSEQSTELCCSDRWINSLERNSLNKALDHFKDWPRLDALSAGGHLNVKRTGVHHLIPGRGDLERQP